MPRPPSDNPRDRLLNFRCTDEEAARLRNKARQSQLSLSDFVRARVLKARKSRSKDAAFLEPVEDTGTRVLALQIHKVGVNLNQITRLMNTYQMPPPPELRDLIDQIRLYVRQANQL